ncbi:hypothetical protein GQ600_27782 [Phytophthora cactorum]|nr:hypothetical protein GQ600_27782 [Phytophthora cactorum]
MASLLDDSSSDVENTPPNISSNQHQDARARTNGHEPAAKSGSVRSVLSADHPTKPQPYDFVASVAGVAASTPCTSGAKQGAAPSPGETQCSSSSGRTNTRTNSLAVVAAEDVGAGEVLGQYLGEIEHRPSLPIRAAINAEKMGGLMRFVNHSWAQMAKFVEVANIRRGEEVPVDYGDISGFICRCGLEGCGHRDIQGEDAHEVLQYEGEGLRELAAQVQNAVQHSKAGHAPRIKKTNEIKMAIDERADVVEMDDGTDTDQRLVEPDLCFNVNADESFYEDCDEDSARLSTGGVRTLNGHADVTATDESVEEDSSESTRSSNRGEFQELLTASLDSEGLEAFARTPRPAPARSEPSARHPGSGCLPLSRKSPVTPMASEVPQPENLPLVIDLASGSRDKPEELKYPNLQTFSNRLGGTNLTTFRDATSGVKRVLEPDSNTLEDSFAKAKRMRAMKTTSALISKLDMVETPASNMRVSILETILLLREENERKAELRRAEENQRHMDELAAREAHRIAEKAEADERRRAENLEIEDRARRDREEARARTQELVMQIGALTKRDYDKRDGSQS